MYLLYHISFGLSRGFEKFFVIFKKNLEENYEIYIREIKSKEKYKEEKEIRTNIVMFTICLQKNFKICIDKMKF